MSPAVVLDAVLLRLEHAICVSIHLADSNLHSPLAACGQGRG